MQTFVEYVILSEAKDLSEKKPRPYGSVEILRAPTKVGGSE